MRLIDADEFKKYISNMPLTNSSKEMFENAIKSQPTAYEIDKVIGELDKQINIAKSEFNLTHDSILIVTISELQRARAIVKQQV